MPDRTIATMAGNGTAGFAGDGSPAASAELSTPRTVCGSPNGNIYVADYGNNRIRLLTRALPAPANITSVVNDANSAGAISAGSWLAIFGTDLAPTGDSRTWKPATEIMNGKLPASLDGTSVTVNGKPATVEFISPSQVNIQTPDDTAVGPVRVVVTQQPAHRITLRKLRGVRTGSLSSNFALCRRAALRH